MKTRTFPSHGSRTPANRGQAAALGEAISPDDPLAQAWRLHLDGRVEDARVRYEALLQKRPKDAAVLRLLGAALCQLDAPARGRGYLEQSIALAPGHIETLMNLGKACGRLRDFDQATRAFGEVARLDPSHAEASFCLANVATDVGRHAEALGYYSRVLSLTPDDLAAWRGAGSSALALDKADDALAFYNQALRIDGQDVVSRANRGAIHLRQGRFQAALDDFDVALAVDPRNASAWNNRGVACKEMGRIDEALDCYRRALALEPDYADAFSNRGNAELVLGRAREARASYERALALKPGHPDAQFNLSMVLMQLGGLPQGQILYEVRRQRRGIRLDLPAERLWTGETSLAGKRLLITMEQGLGDMLQFCRYVLLARAHGAQVLLETPQPLMRLLSTLGPDITLVPMGPTLPDFDVACPVMSLPHAFRTQLNSIPAPIPYLRAEPAAAAAWAQRLAQDARSKEMKVGLVWSGGFRQDQPDLWAVNQRRNLPLDQLAPLRMAGIRFISLQKGADAEAQLHALQAQGWEGPQIEDYTADLHDFADTAALIHNLDLVISVDTSTAHLAGATGKPTWIFSRLDGCWRWLLERDDSPWYPSVRLFRQTELGQWGPVVAQVRAALAENLSRGAARA